MSYLERVLALANPDVPASHDVSFPTESDTSYEAKLLQADQTGTFYSSQRAMQEADALPPLDKVKLQAHCDDARECLADADWNGAAGHLCSAYEVCRLAGAHHLCHELGNSIKSTFAMGSRTLEPSDAEKDNGGPRIPPGGDGGPAGQGPNASLSRVVALAIGAIDHPFSHSQRPYARVEHGVEERVGGHGEPQGPRLAPPVTAENVEEHIATAHGHGAGWAQASSANPLMRGNRPSPQEMMRMHEELHMHTQAHSHAPVVVRRNVNPAAEAQRFLSTPSAAQMQGLNTAKYDAWGRPR